MFRQKEPITRKLIFTFLSMPATTQIKILSENLTDINPRKIPFILRCLLHGILAEILAVICGIHVFRKRSRSLTSDPVFILGHWRSGTTWLHELLMNDCRFLSPGTLECLRPRTFFLDDAILRIMEKMHLVNLSPESRVMDNVKISIHSPQEDEMALLALGAPSQMRRAFFFKNYGDFSQHQGWDGLSPRKIRKICHRWLGFLCRVQDHRGPEKQFLLKSPQHSWRVAVLRSLFPNAKFVLIVRRPEDVYVSFKNLLHTYFQINSLSRSQPDVTETEFLNTYLGMHEKLFAEMAGIAGTSFTVIRYEDLKADTVGTVRKIYTDLALENTEAVTDALSRKLASVPPYKPHPKNMRVRFSDARLDMFLRRFGYGSLSEEGSLESIV